MKICDIRRRTGGWNAVEVDVAAVSPGREIDQCVLAGDLDQAVGLFTRERASAIRPNHDPHRGSAQFAPNSVSSEVGK